jgi:hypothetical protein
MFAPPAANLDQIRNGSAASRTDPADWVNGNAGASQAHYREGYSIAYRLVLTNLANGPHNVKIEWDIKNGGKNAIDYITYYNRINSPNHFVVFGHNPEVIDPTGAAPGSDSKDLVTGLTTTTPFQIPRPNNTSPTTATASFEALPLAERQMTVYNGTGVVMTYDSEGSLAASNSSTRLNIAFSTSMPTVVLAWGGHIASAQDWGAGNSASSVSGSPYHTRLISLDGTGGNQDRSLSASAVIVDCATCSVGVATTAECGTQKVHTSTIGAGGVCDTPQHSWSFVSNTSGATFATATNLASVTVNVGTGCSSSSVGYTVRDTITCSGCTTGSTIFCDQQVTVSDTTNPVIGSPGTSGSIQCPNSPVFTAPTATDNCSTPIVSVVSDVTTPSGCTGVYSRTVTWKATDACGNMSGNVSQTIMVVDTTAPTIGAAGADATIQCPATPVFTPPTASDTCGGATVHQLSDTTTPGSCAGSYSRTKTWDATDCSGNHSATRSQTITVEDHTAPVIGSPGANATIECPATPTFTPPTATDACDQNPAIVEVSDVTTDGTCPGTYDRTKTWKARDACGNESGNVSQTIHVVDTTPPQITKCPADVSVTCKPDVDTLGDFSTLGGEASDSCGSVTVTASDSEPFDTSSCGTDCGGKITRTYTAKDCAGLTDTCEQIITYGTPGSLQSAQQLVIASLLKSGDVVVGVSGTSSLTIPGGPNANSSALCIVSKLSASGTASPLAAGFGDQRLNPSTCQTSPSLELQKDGTWNVVLSQTISLALNLRMNTQQQQLKQNAQASGLSVLRANRPDADFDLSSFTLTSSFLTQGALPGLDGLMGTSDDELDLSSARTQFVIPASVLAALGSNATATDLLRLANAALAGIPTGDVKLSDIAAALDAVNRSFDFGKRRIILNSQPSQR